MRFLIGVCFYCLRAIVFFYRVFYVFCVFYLDVLKLNAWGRATSMKLVLKAMFRQRSW